ncbi:MAG: ABC transporter permease, partial [Bacteroidetes bacterium]|nr:ABC transporter permease [Bacteroidota bacterium]
IWKIVMIDTGDIPYPVFVLTGLSSWYYFTYLVSNAGTSLVSAQTIIKKIYFPKLVIPVSKAITGFVNLLITLLLLFIFMVITGRYPNLNIIGLPVIILLNIITGLAFGIWLSALTIRFRDFHHIIPYIIGFGIWITPVFYPISLIPESYRHFIYLNPMAAVAEGYRWALLGGKLPSPWFLTSLIAVFVLLITGMLYFRKNEGKIADMI